ncbi:MAG TPA: hypothetical protein VLM11_18540 [Streptosporangiaceae bacterium]|nr:hypothetical protein [Streptosporangiaceae bacterium]
MFFLLFLLVRFSWWLAVVSFYFLWVCIALPVTLILSATGNKTAARRWSRSMNWRRVFNPF